MKPLVGKDPTMFLRKIMPAGHRAAFMALYVGLRVAVALATYLAYAGKQVPIALTIAFYVAALLVVCGIAKSLGWYDAPVESSAPFRNPDLQPALAFNALKTPRPTLAPRAPRAPRSPQALIRPSAPRSPIVQSVSIAVDPALIASISPAAAPNAPSTPRQLYQLRQALGTDQLPLWRPPLNPFTSGRTAVFRAEPGDTSQVQPARQPQSQAQLQLAPEPA